MRISAMYCITQSYYLFMHVEDLFECMCVCPCVCGQQVHHHGHIMRTCTCTCYRTYVVEWEEGGGGQKERHLSGEEKGVPRNARTEDCTPWAHEWRGLKQVESALIMYTRITVDEDTHQQTCLFSIFLLRAVIMHTLGEASTYLSTGIYIYNCIHTWVCIYETIIDNIDYVTRHWYKMHVHSIPMTGMYTIVCVCSKKMDFAEWCLLWSICLGELALSHLVFNGCFYYLVVLLVHAILFSWY